ncbi:MAG: CusA/CzcA family heavy metal efflux RND transporter [Bacteroidota bacterium]
MNKIIGNILAFSLKNKYFILFATGLIAVIGIICYLNTPIEAFPDFTNTQIKIITQWQGRSAEEIEKFITIPIETEMNSVQKKTNLRSISLFGLSVITIIFDDDVDDFFARQQVANRLMNVSLPDGIQPEMEPPYGPTGEIYRFTLKSKTKTPRELKTIEDWVIERNLKQVQGVADINSFGGDVKTFEIGIDPNLLAKYNITSLDVYKAVSSSNVNVGGDIIEKSSQAYVVRGIGLINNIQEIENIVIDNFNGTPLLVKNIGKVMESGMPRLGQVGLGSQDDVVEGIVVMRKGENPGEVLKSLKEKIKELNEEILPPDVKIETFYDRTTLTDYTTHTVLHNLFEGIILVTVVVFLFMADWRTTLIVSIIIPLSLLFAFILMKIKGMSANLLSIGAIDFGIIIDGAVVMVEGIFVMLSHKAEEVGMPQFNRMSKLGAIRKKGIDMGKAIFFSKMIIITALIPIFAFQKVEGKMFSPLAYTLGFALLGALIFSLTFVPVLASMLLNKNVHEKRNRLVDAMNSIYKRVFDFVFKRKVRSLVVAIIILVVSLGSFSFLGSEFLPHLNEGALWVEAQLPMSVSLTDAEKVTSRMREIILKFEEVKGVLSQTGRPDDGTDPSGFFSIQCHVDLKPQEEWKNKETLDELNDRLNDSLNQIPGLVFNFSQPILDNVEEAVAGINASQAIKIFGTNLKVLDKMADSVYNIIKTVRGVDDLGILRNLGQPEMRIELDQTKMAYYGVSTQDAQAVIEMAIGGKEATKVYEDEKKFDLRIRYQPQYRKDEKDIGNLMVPTLNGNKIPIKQLAEIKTITGPAYVYRDNNARFIAVKFSIRDRDLGGAIQEAQAKVNAAIKPEKGYKIIWSGEFESQIRAQERLKMVVPISLLLIFLILFITFGNSKDAMLVLFNVPFALIGGILALLITHTNFSISAGIGFIALFGVSIQNGVLLLSEFKANLFHRQHLSDAIRNGVMNRLRPVVMTALMASLGLLPAALSTGIGSETQKPLAIVVIGGLISATILVLLILPCIYYLANYRSKKFKMHADTV